MNSSSISSSSSTSLLLLLLFCITLLLSPSDIHASFVCTSSSSSPCTSFVGYVSPNSTTLSAITTLFNVTHFSILGPNKLPPSTPSNHLVRANQTLNIPFDCSCSNGSGSPTNPPIYTVVSGDGLYHIATDVFSSLMLYPQIQEFNGIPDANNITVGQKLRIPLPCSCDEEEGQRVVHYAHVVPPGASLEEIAEKFNVPEVTLQKRNNLTAPADLKADAVLDVPLPACSSSRVITLGTGSSNATCHGSSTPAAPSPSSAGAVRLDGRRWWWNQELLLILVPLLYASL